MGFACVVKVRQKQVLGFVGRQYLQLVCIFDVHHLVANVISCFHEVDQWMAGIFQRLLVQFRHAEFFGNAAEAFFFTGKEAEFRFSPGQAR